VKQPSIYAWKSGGSNNIDWPRTRKSGGGQLTPLTPCFRGLWPICYRAHRAVLPAIAWHLVSVMSVFLLQRVSIYARDAVALPSSACVSVHTSRVGNLNLDIVYKKYQLWITEPLISLPHVRAVSGVTERSSIARRQRRLSTGCFLNYSRQTYHRKMHRFNKIRLQPARQLAVLNLAVSATERQLVWGNERHCCDLWLYGGKWL